MSRPRGAAPVARPLWRILAVPAAVELGMMGGCHTAAAPAEPAQPPNDAAAERVVSPLPPPVPSAGAFALGINEAFAVPLHVRGEMNEAELARAIEGDGRQTRKLGATWVRGHTANFPRISCDKLDRGPTALAEMDLWVHTLGTDLHGVAMLSPWPGNATAGSTDHYVPADLAAYGACITKVVERYDGDGVDDMPGLVQPVRYWEFDNEPDLKNSLPARGATRDYDPTTFCTPTEYATVLLATSKAVRAADPSAKLLALGLFRPHAEQGQTYARAVLAVSGAAEAFDIVSLHTYHDDDGERLGEGIREIRVLLPGKPVWITEASVSSESGEEDQGRRVAAYVAQAAAAGAERLFWHTLADPPSRGGGRPRGGGGGGHFTTNSLLRGIDGAAPEEKPAGAVYRNLAAKLASDDLIGAALDGDGAVKLHSGAALLFRGERAAPHGGVNLLTGARLEPGAVAHAPAWLGRPPPSPAAP